MNNIHSNTQTMHVNSVLILGILRREMKKLEHSYIQASIELAGKQAKKAERERLEKESGDDLGSMFRHSSDPTDRDFSNVSNLKRQKDEHENAINWFTDHFIKDENVGDIK